MTHIIISYRDAQAAAALRLVETLRGTMPHAAITVDVANLTAPISAESVVLVIIGRRWASGLWLNDPTDADRTAIAAALEAGSAVIPVLVDGADMPPSHALPDDLRLLIRYNPVTLNSADSRPVVRRIEAALEDPSARAPSRLRTFLSSPLLKVAAINFYGSALFFHAEFIRFVDDLLAFIGSDFIAMFIPGALAGCVLAATLRYAVPRAATQTLALIVVASGIATGIFFEGFNRTAFGFDTRIRQEFDWGELVPWIILCVVVISAGLAFACSRYNRLLPPDAPRFNPRRTLRAAVLLAVLPTAVAAILAAAEGILHTSYEFSVALVFAPYNALAALILILQFRYSAGDRL